MSEEVKTIEETKDEMTYYEMQMLVGMANSPQRYILLYGLKKTLLNKYIENIIILQSLSGDRPNNQVNRKRRARRNDSNNLDSIIRTINLKIEAACRELGIENTESYKITQETYEDKKDGKSMLTKSLDNDEFSKIASKIQLLEKSYDNEWTTTTENKEKGTETKTTINPPAECKNITEEVFIGELYNRISSNKLVEISLDDNGKVIDENKLMDYIIYLSESSENHERRKFKYIIEYINQNIEVIEGLDKDIYGKIMQQLNSKNTPITEYTDDKLSVEETFYLSNIARQAVKKIEKDIKAIKQRKLEPVQEEVVEETIDPVKEFSEKLNDSWIRTLLNQEFVDIAKSSDLGQYIKQITYESMLENINIEGEINFEAFENAAIEIIIQKIINLKPELRKFIDTFGIKEKDYRIRICIELGYNGGDDLKKAIEYFEAEKAKETKEQEEQTQVKLSELETTKKLVKSAIEQLKSIKDKQIEGIEITDEIRDEIESLPDEIEEKDIGNIIDKIDKISIELFNNLHQKLDEVTEKTDGTYAPEKIRKSTLTANVAIALLESLTSRQSKIDIRIKFVQDSIKELEEYIQKRKTTIEFDKKEYNIEIETDRNDLFSSLMQKINELKSLDEDSRKNIADKLNSLKKGNTTKEEIENLIDLITKLHIQASLPQPQKEKADE